MEPVTEIPVDMDQEEVAYIFDKYHLISAPVIEPGGRLVGQITVDDIVGVIQDESEEDSSQSTRATDARRVVRGLEEERRVLRGPVLEVRELEDLRVVRLIHAGRVTEPLRGDRRRTEEARTRQERNGERDEPLLLGAQMDCRRVSIELDRLDVGTVVSDEAPVR